MSDDSEPVTETTKPRDIIKAALLRMHRSGESYDMGARWVMEDLTSAGLQIVPIQPPHYSIDLSAESV